MAADDCKTEIIAGWYLGGEDSAWAQTVDFNFCQQSQQPQHQQMHHHLLHHQLDFAPVDPSPGVDLRPQQQAHQVFPTVACSGFSSPASFLTPDASDSSGYLLAMVPPPGDCDSSGSSSGVCVQLPQQQPLQPAVTVAAPSGPSASGGSRRGGSGGSRRQQQGTSLSAPDKASGQFETVQDICGAAGSSAAAPKVKTPGMVAKRNARERRRVEAVNSAFARLRKYIPYEKRNKRLSKVKTLRITIDYIRLLEVVLEELNSGVDIERSPNYHSLMQLAQRKEIAIPLSIGS